MAKEEFKGVNKDAIAKDREAKKRGSDFWTPDEGETLVYVAPPPPGVEGFPYVEAVFHFKAKNGGKDSGVALCLDKTVNPLLEDDEFLGRLKELGRDADDLDTCIIDKALDEGDLDKKIKDAVKRSPRYLFNIIPVRHRKKPTAPWVELGEGLRPYMCSYTVWDGICSVIGDLGDITDPNQAVLVKITRTGRDMNTKYKVDADSATIKRPMVLDKNMKTALREALKSGGDGDLLRIVAAMTKDSTRMAADWGGMPVDEGDDDDKPSKPACFGVDWDDSKDCRKCPHSKACKGKSSAKKPKEAEEEAEDSEEEEAEEKPKTKLVKASDCDTDTIYDVVTVDGEEVVAAFKGPSKKKPGNFLFKTTDEDAKLFSIPGSTRVKVHVEEEEPEEEEEEEAEEEEEDSEEEAEAEDEEEKPKKGKGKKDDEDSEDDDDAKLKDLEKQIRERAKKNKK